MENIETQKTYMICAFSRLTNVNKIWNLIGKHFFMPVPSLLKINTEKLIKYLYYNKCYELTLINIKNTPNFKLGDDYNPLTSKLEYTKLPGELNNTKNKEVNYLFIELELEKFLNNKQVDQELLLLIKDSLFKNVIFIFNDISWFYLKSALKFKKNVILRGPSANKTHILSPLEERLSLFSRALQHNLGDSTIDSIIPESFQNTSTLLNKNLLNLNSEKQIHSSLKNLNNLIFNGNNIKYKDYENYTTKYIPFTVRESLDEISKSYENIEKEIENKDIIKNNISKLNNSKITSFPINLNEQKRKFHTSNILHNNIQYEDINLNEISDFSTAKKIFYKKIEDKIKNELNVNGLNINDKNRDKLVLNIIENFWKFKLFFDPLLLYEIFHDIIEMINEHNLLQEYIDMIKKENNFESLENIIEDIAINDLLIIKLYEKINYNIINLEIDKEDFKKLFTITWNKINQKFKNNKVDSKNISNEFFKIISELDMKNEFINLNKHENKENITPFNFKNNPFNNCQKREFHTTSSVYLLNNNTTHTLLDLISEKIIDKVIKYEIDIVEDLLLHTKIKMKTELSHVDIPIFIYLKFALFLWNKINLELKDELQINNIEILKFYNYQKFFKKLENCNITNEYINFIKLNFDTNLINLIDDNYYEFISKYFTKRELESTRGYNNYLKIQYFKNKLYKNIDNNNEIIDSKLTNIKFKMVFNLFNKPVTTDDILYKLNEELLNNKLGFDIDIIRPLFKDTKFKIKNDLLDIIIPIEIYLNFVLHFWNKINLNLQNEIGVDNLQVLDYHYLFNSKLEKYNTKYEYIYYINSTYDLNIYKLDENNYINFIENFKEEEELNKHMNIFNTCDYIKYNPFKSNIQKRDFHTLILLNKTNSSKKQKRDFHTSINSLNNNNYINNINSDECKNINEEKFLEKINQFIFDLFEIKLEIEVSNIIMSYELFNKFEIYLFIKIKKEFEIENENKNFNTILYFKKFITKLEQFDIKKEYIKYINLNYNNYTIDNFYDDKYKQFVFDNITEKDNFYGISYEEFINNFDSFKRNNLINEETKYKLKNIDFYSSINKIINYFDISFFKNERDPYDNSNKIEQDKINEIIHILSISKKNFLNDKEMLLFKKDIEKSFKFIKSKAILEKIHENFDKKLENEINLDKNNLKNKNINNNIKIKFNELNIDYYYLRSNFLNNQIKQRLNIFPIKLKYVIISDQIFYEFLDFLILIKIEKELEEIVIPHLIWNNFNEDFKWKVKKDWDLLKLKINTVENFTNLNINDIVYIINFIINLDKYDIKKEYINYINLNYNKLTKKEKFEKIIINNLYDDIYKKFVFNNSYEKDIYWNKDYDYFLQNYHEFKLINVNLDNSSLYQKRVFKNLFDLCNCYIDLNPISKNINLNEVEENNIKQSINILSKYNKNYLTKKKIIYLQEILVNLYLIKKSKSIFNIQENNYEEKVSLNNKNENNLNNKIRIKNNKNNPFNSNIQKREYNTLNLKYWYNKNIKTPLTKIRQKRDLQVISKSDIFLNSCYIRNFDLDLNQKLFNIQKREIYTPSLFFSNVSIETKNNNNNNSSKNIKQELININKNIHNFKNKSLISFIDNYLNNPIFKIINNILNKKNINNNQKQEIIEEQLTDIWRKEITSLFSKEEKFIKSSYGRTILTNNVLKLEQNLIDWKTNDRRFLSKKVYKNLIYFLNNQDIIAIVLSNVIPFSIKYEDKLSQNLVNLYEKIGISCLNIFLKTEWENYKNNYKLYSVDFKNYNIKNYSLPLNENEYNEIIENLELINFEPNLTINEFKNKLINIIGTFTSEDFLKLGLDLIVFISEKSSLFKIETQFIEKDKEKRVLIPDYDLKQDILRIIIQDSDLLPMICKPIDWVYEKKDKDDSNNNIKFLENIFKVKNYGGFISNKNDKLDLIRRSHRSIGSTHLQNHDLINTINYLSSIKYCINNNVLYYILNLFENNDERINELIKINLHPDHDDLGKLMHTNNFYKVNEISKYDSQFYNDNTVLQVALLFSNWTNEEDNSIFFPLFVEWRGRIYTNTGSFTYQKSELAKSLIKFKEGFKLNESGLEALKIYTANCFGIDKLSYDKRLEWIETNLENILKLDKDFIFTAKEPLLFLACSFELKEYYNDPKNFISQLPISKDATCNGLQHLSQMVSDSNLANYVNIKKSNKEDIPGDVYGYMVNRINEEIKKLIDKSYEFVKLDYLNITRTFIKWGIMTIPYGSTVRGLTDQLKKDFFIFIGKQTINKKKVNAYKLKDNTYNKNNINFFLTVTEINCLGQIIHNILYDSFPSLKILVKYLKDMNKFLKDLNLFPIWLTPGGLVIEQKYVEFTEKIINSKILGKKKSATKRIPIKDKINLRQQNAGIVANVVHSFDASNISLLIKELVNNKNNINILTIHDCFATHANNVELMTLHVKLGFLLLYTNKNFINSYHDFILNYLKNSGIIINEIEDGTTFVNLKVKIVNKKTNVEKEKIKKLIIPKIPKFDYKEFKENILGSQYFIN